MKGEERRCRRQALCKNMPKNYRKEMRQAERNKTPRGGENARSLKNLHSATDTLSGLLAKQVKALAARSRAEPEEAAEIKGLKEATAVLKDLAAVAKTLSEQGAAEAESAECGVVLLPRVDDGAES